MKTFEEYMNENHGNSAEDVRKYIVELTNKLHSLTPEEIDQHRDVLQPLHDFIMDKLSSQ